MNTAYVPVSDEEIKHRVAVLKKLRSYLVKQREHFMAYLSLLDREEDAITSGDVERLELHVEMEHKLLKDIFAFQKVISPLKDMYKAAFPAGNMEIEQLDESIESLKEKALAHNHENRRLLRLQMDVLKEKIANLNIPRFRKNVFSASQKSGMVDILT
ncbi:flagellar export chaperone FlgN [Spirochaetia bacterium 38H-sp]|uniref:Flagellar export chaperone FlgN n=1 Tax=Rarispira pelagica TaxID=3141764 RepID=A0ABU9U9Q8_9SPIR